MLKFEYNQFIKDAEWLPLELKIALTVYGEARDQLTTGKEALAYVCLQREKDNLLWNDILDPKQFSCWNYGDPNLEVIRNAKVFEPIFHECLRIAIGVCRGEITNPLPEPASHYYAPKAMQKLYNKSEPYWAKDMKLVGQIGDHVFLRET